ncbi:MAG: hypothetical protein OQL16_10775 [Gammaproteobacteria bacterium]|nr:hypothetical protein [Gammaproteobacteria bacterium]
MKFNSILLAAASITLFLAMPTTALAAEDAGADEAFKKRQALSNKIKSMKELRREMPIPPPAGLFGIYSLPKPGDFIAGINYQNHKFEGLLDGDNHVSSAEAVATAPNIFFGNPMQPATLRQVPKRAEADVAFPFINYTVDERFSLVALAPLLDKKTVLETFNAPGTASLGTTTVTAKGLGDVKFGFLYTPFKSYNDKGVRKHNLLFDVVLSAPTGSIKEDDTVLNPMGAQQKTRLPYGMQLGSGTWDALLGVAYWGKQDKWGWGAQYLGTIPLENENDEGWRYGDKHELTSWVSYEWKPTLATSLRLRHESQGRIKGIDPKIYGPGLGANPGNYGGERTELALGANWMYSPGHNLSVEYAKPVSQDRHGVQADYDQSLMFSWRNAFF